MTGCGLPAAWAGQPSWCCLHIGFGSGQHFLAAWHAWRADPARPRTLHVVATLCRPPAAAELLRAVQAALQPLAQAELLVLAQALSQQFTGLLPGVHRLSFEHGQVLLTLCVGPAQAQLREQAWLADSVLLNPDPAESIDIYLLKAVARRCRRGTHLVSLSTASAVVDGLRQCGFEVSELPTASPTPSPTQPRLQARFEPAWASPKKPLSTPAFPPVSAHPAGRALVIGAGLAGAAAAASLSKRGWQVIVLDAGASVASGASALPAGLMAPHTSPDDSWLSRLSRSGLRATWQAAAELLAPGLDYAATGVLQRRLDPTEGGTLPAGWPREGHAWSRPASFAQLHDVQPGDCPPALWHEAGGWIKPARLVQALLAQPGIQLQLGASVAQLKKDSAGWHALNADGHAVAQADVVVLAAGFGSAALAQPLAGTVALQAIRGQVSWGPAEGAVLPTFPVNGHGSFVPAFSDAEGQKCWLIGATFERNQPLAEVREADHAANLARLQVLLPATAASLEKRFSTGDVRAWAGVRCASPDRLPLVGPLDDVNAPGLWACTALGSRGLTFAVLCGELLAAWLHAEPLPLAPKLAQALRASRFAERR